MRIGLFIALAAALASPAAAAGSGLRPCDDVGVGLWAVVPGANNRGIRSFYDGQVTLFELDTIEPAAAPAGVAVVIPDVPDVEGIPTPQCWAVINFSSVDVAAARARYDPRQGLTLTIPTWRYDEESSRSVPAEPIRLRIDAGRGTIVEVGAARR